MNEANGNDENSDHFGPPSNRIHQYLNDEDGYQNWINTNILMWHWKFEEPLKFTETINAACREMFAKDFQPVEAARFIATILKNPYKQHKKTDQSQTDQGQKLN